MSDEEMLDPEVIPVVPVYHVMSAPAHIGFWCPWCHRHHVHGAAGGDGLRVAHCHSKKSPLYGQTIDIIYAGRIRDYAALPRMTVEQLVVLSNFIARDDETPRGVMRFWWAP